MTDDLILTWLRAQLDEDERDAPNRHRLDCRYAPSDGNEPCSCGLPDLTLAEVDVKRRILDMYVLDYDADGRAYVVGGYGEAWLGSVRLLALPFADREGYRDEWRP